MNKLIFIGRFTSEDLEFINTLVRKRYFAHVKSGEFMSEFEDENTLSVVIDGLGSSFIIELREDYMKIQSDQFSTMCDVANILSDNFEEDWDLKDNFYQAN